MVSGNNACRVDNSSPSVSTLIAGRRIHDKCNFYPSDIRDWRMDQQAVREKFRAGTVIIPENRYSGARIIDTVAVDSLTTRTVFVSALAFVCPQKRLTTPAICFPCYVLVIIC